jgi:hypothetical protein
MVEELLYVIDEKKMCVSFWPSGSPGTPRSSGRSSQRSWCRFARQEPANIGWMIWHTKEDNIINLGLILDLHILGCQQLHINPLQQSGRDDIPYECIQEEESEIHDIHDHQRKCNLVPTKSIPEKSIHAALDLHADHHLNQVAEWEHEIEIWFREFTTKD